LALRDVRLPTFKILISVRMFIVRLISCRERT